MRLFNLKNVIEKPTRVTNHIRTLLDPIIVSDTINYVNSDVFKLPDNISDHDASVVTIQCSKNISRLSKKNIPIPNVAEKNILILVEEKKKI